MTIFGWDMSHYDWDRGLTASEITAAAGGVSFMTHKIGEGAGYTDPRFDDFWRATRGLDGVLLGAYYVNHPGDQVAQADRFLRLLDQQAPGWRDRPFILQVDAERFDYMDRAPNLAELKAFVARLRAKAPDHRPIVYAPRWVYGDSLRGLDAPLWASNYGSNPSTSYRSAYPGDSSSRWAAYSGQTPAILQYGSKTTIGTQRTCDANAYRGSLDALTALVYPGGDDDMPTAAEIADAVVKKLDTAPIRNGRTVGGCLDALCQVDGDNPSARAVWGTRWPNPARPGTTTAMGDYQSYTDVHVRRIIDAISGAASAAAERDQQILALVADAQSGQLAAEDVVARIGELLTAAAPGAEADAS